MSKTQNAILPPATKRARRISTVTIPTAKIPAAIPASFLKAVESAEQGHCLVTDNDLKETVRPPRKGNK